MKRIDVQRLIGAWRLVRWQVDYSDGRPTEYPFGPDAVGLIVYAANGSMSAMLSRKERTPLSVASAAQASVESKARALDEYLSYTARWHAEGDELVHQVESALNPVLIGTEQRRQASLSDRGLLLEAREQLVRRDGAHLERVHRLHWSKENY